MRVFTHTLVHTALIPLLALSLSGCGLMVAASNVGSTAGDDRGNALKVDYQLSSDEALNEFETFVEERDMEITSKKEAKFVASGNIEPSSQMRGGQDVRMKVFARRDDSNTSIIVIAEYLEPTSGEYKRATNNTGVMTTREESRSTEFRTFTRLEQILISKYGGDNVEAIDSDLTY